MMIFFFFWKRVSSSTSQCLANRFFHGMIKIFPQPLTSYAYHESNLIERSSNLRCTPRFRGIISPKVRSHSLNIRGENSKIVEISKFYESTGSHGRKPPIEFRLRFKRKFTKNSSPRFDHRFLSLISPLSALHRSFLSAIILITSVPARLNINILSSHHSRSTHRISFLRIFPFTTCSVDKHAGRERIKKSEEAKKRFGSRSDRGAGMERERGSRLRNLLARDCRLNCQVKTQHLSTCTGAHREPPDWYLER